MNVNDVIQLIEAKTRRLAKRSGAGYSACCPAHDDENPSLSISEGNDGKVLVNCFAGCSVESICDSLGISTGELFSQTIASEKVLKPQRIEYPYQDESGERVFSKVRIEPGFNGKVKSFYCERADDRGRIVRNLTECRRVLYRLPELLLAVGRKDIIFLVEGEKDADKLIGYGLAATTAPSSLQWCDEYTDVLREADVVILYDADKTGVERRDLLIEKLLGNVKRLRVVSLPGVEFQESHGKDISDWLAEGHTTQELLEVVKNTLDSIEQLKEGAIRVITMEGLINMTLPKREMVLGPILPTQGLGLLYAKRGVGKTHVALGIGYAVASGGTFFKWTAPMPRKVLYLDGEMPASAMQERLQRMAFAEELKMPDPSFFQLITPDLQDGPMPDLATKAGREVIDQSVEESDFVIIDNISTLFRTGEENEADSWQSVQDWALELRRRGKTVLFIHHAGKGGAQRGTSKREDILDTVVGLKHPAGYRAEQGAVFEVAYEKTRHFAGDAAADFTVALVEQEDGLWEWEIGEMRVDADIKRVAEYVKEGRTIKEIEGLMQLTKSQVETRKKKAKEQGLIE